MEAVSADRTVTTPPLDERAGDAHPNEVIGAYEVLTLLGRGGMGVVYRARQSGLQRIVALKMMAGTANSGDLARFHAEAKAIAQLQHPNIVQIYEAGAHRGRPFFSLEFVDGGNLSQKIKRGLLSFRQAGAMLETLARAVHFAHQHGILHRDLKPANILLTAAGVPKVTDFGLAKNFAATLGAEALTRTGDILGTLSYMAPEQARGGGQLLGPATDVYALGAILYEMLTGRPPFVGQNKIGTLGQVLREEPAPPRLLRSEAPLDLEIICLKCLEKDPQRRYASAEALAEDLNAYLAGMPIQARAPGMSQRLRRWARQHPAAATLGSVGLVAGFGVLVGLWWHAAVAVAALAVVSLCLAAWWYNARLERALADLEQQLRRDQRNMERLHLLLETNNRLLETRDMDEVLHVLGHASTRLVGAERASIFLVDQAKDELWSKVALGTGVGELRIPLGMGIAGAVARTGEIINLAKPYDDARFNPEIDRATGYVTRNLLTLPMTDPKGHILGVFQVLNKREGSFSAEDVALLVHLAKAAAIAVNQTAGGTGFSPAPVQSVGPDPR